VGKATQQQERNKYGYMGWNTKSSIVSDIRQQRTINSLLIIVVWIIHLGSLNWKTIQNYTSGTHRRKTKYVKITIFDPYTLTQNTHTAKQSRLSDN